MNFMQFWHQKGNFSTLNLRFAYFVRSKMPFNGIIMLLGMNNTKLERKILIILHFENGFLPTYLPLWPAAANRERMLFFKRGFIFQAAQGNGSVIRRAFSTPSIRRALLLGCLLQLFQQVAGINTVMYYSAKILSMAGFSDDTQAEH